MSAEDTGAEGRRTPRQHVDVLVPVINAMTRRALGLTRDISRGGMKVQVAAPLVDHALYQVQVELQLGDRRLPVEGGMQVIHQERLPDGSILAGVRFIHLDAANRQRLVEWLAAADAPTR
ncbi:PilZ domain-containing protein [Marilutibacter chinensis]|uniref:PilZ domain-containing protein n=1 Tax=Marilutibacter chinensis TaxID=2912247 RepID=A0ABS9HQD5_9GAMM|nr:PilZ domain-containing protein [Lysobacter chinensis]